MNIISKYAPSNESPFTYADVTFNENLELKSNLFDDIYYSKCGAVAECTHVFINGNNLKYRILNIVQNKEANNDLVIAETGFGTGINFITTLGFLDNLAIENNITIPKITYLAFEKFPLKLEELALAHNVCPELKEYSNKLLACYKDLKVGINILHITPNIDLILVIEDIEISILALELSRKVDIWYLDGFAPTQNIAMWSELTFNNMVRLSNNNATFATFTVAGFVRRGLAAAGFTVSKIKGFAQKKEMLVGILKS